MRLLWFYISRTFVNSIKKLFRTWVAVLIGICLLIGIIGGIVGGFAAGMSADQSEISSGTHAQNTPAEGEVFEETEENSEIDTQTLYAILEAGIGLVALLMMLGYFYFADKNGTAIFTMPDVNFLFPAPLKPQTVLLFRTVLKMGLILLGSIYLLFQLPNLVLNLGLDLFSALMLIAAWVIIVILCQLISIFTYTVAATHPSFRKYIRPAAIAVLLLVTIGVAQQVIVGRTDVWQAILKVFAGKTGRWIPLWGWVRGFVMCAIERNWMMSVLYLILLLLAIFLAVGMIWRFKADFYEDALVSAMRNQEATEKAKKKNTAVFTNKKRKSAEKKAGEIGRGQGAQMFLIKSMYNRRRFAKWGLFTGTAVLYLLICGTFAVIQRFFLPSSDLTILSVVLLFVLFFRNFGNPIAQETQCPYLFMIPAKSAEKLYYCLLAGLYDTICDIAPIYLAAVLFINGNLFTALLWLLLFLSFDLINSVSGLLLELSLPSNLHIMIRSSLQMLMKMWPLLPNILILLFFRYWINLYAALFIAFAFNIAFAALLFAFCPALLHKGKN